MSYNSYHSSWTRSYKQGYIFGATIDGHEVIKCQVDAHAYVIYVKSFRAAQLLISKHAKKLKGSL
jgi:hypothetical protein